MVDHYDYSGKYREYKVDAINSVFEIYNKSRLDNRKDRKKDREKGKKDNRKYLHTLLKAAEDSNKRLAEIGVPIKFCIYEENKRIMLELVLIDKDGKVGRQIIRDVTDVDFETLIEDVSSIEGLLIDLQS